MIRISIKKPKVRKICLKLVISKFLKNLHNYANHSYCDVILLTCAIISMIDVKVFSTHFIKIYSFKGFCSFIGLAGILVKYTQFCNE